MIKIKRITRKATILIAAICLLLIAIQDVNSEMVKVYGIVADKDTDKPIPTAEVMFISDAGDTTRTTTSTDGSYEVFLEVLQTSVDKTSRPENIILYQNFPNPFNPLTTIEYELKNEINVQINIYNITGQLIRILKNERENRGKHRVIWNGCDKYDKSVSSGIYFFQLRAGEICKNRKMLLIDGGSSNNVLNIQQETHSLLKSVKNDSFNFEIIVEKDGYETYKESVFSLYGDVQEIRKDFTLSSLSESYLLHFCTNHFYDWFYAIDDTVEIRLVSSSDLSLNPTETAALPDSATVILTTVLGDMENIQLNKFGALYISYFDKCGQWPDTYMKSLRGQIFSSLGSSVVINNGILEVKENDVIMAFYTTNKEKEFSVEIPIVTTKYYTYKNVQYEYWNGKWYSDDSFVYSDRFVVKFAEETTEKQILTFNEEMGVTIIEKTVSNLFILSIPEGKNPFDIVKKYHEYEIVDWAEIEGGGCHVIPAKYFNN